ncbi:MAG: hypothetical protein ABGX20_05560 [Bacillus sp. (in: firmicutes)]
MIRKIRVIYTASDDQEFGEVEDEVIVLSSDIVLERYDDTEGVFYITQVGNDQESIIIDRATCPSFLIDFDKPVDEINYEQLSKCTFLEFIRTFARAPKRCM